MPLSTSFEKRLYPLLPALREEFRTPFHIYDEKGIRDSCRRLKKAAHGIYGFQEYFAVKALPNLSILNIMHDMGFGFDCSSQIELDRARAAGAEPEDIMFTSNNTLLREFAGALSDGGSIINLDDVSLMDKLCQVTLVFPDLICFRLNPGKEREGNSIIGTPEKAKYGITYDQLIPAYKEAFYRGAKRFGLHTMVCSNERDYRYMVKTADMLLKAIEKVNRELGITFDFINIGGGVGIPYDPTIHKEFNIEKMMDGIRVRLNGFKKKHGWVPKLFMESGRYMTGPHGALVATAINRKETYQIHVGVDSGMPDLMRPGIYGSYHHITILDNKGVPRDTSKDLEKVNIVGAICENCDRLATDRMLPKIRSDEQNGDFVVTHDTGAHGSAMGFNYNGRLRCQELLLRMDGSVELIRRAETIEDLDRVYQITHQVYNPTGTAAK